MSEIKVSATFLLPGSTLIAEKPISKKGKNKEELELMKQEYERTHHQETVVFTIKRQRHVLQLWIRNSKPATQKMNLSKEAYDYMTSNESFAGIANKNDWAHTSKVKRVKLHLMDIAQSLNAKLLDFVILKD